jgi:hypothetical protein
VLTSSLPSYKLVQTSVNLKFTQQPQVNFLLKLEVYPATLGSLIPVYNFSLIPPVFGYVMFAVDQSSRCMALLCQTMSFDTLEAPAKSKSQLHPLFLHH